MKLTKKNIDTLSGLVHAKLYEEFMNYQHMATNWAEPYDRMIWLSLLVRSLFIGRRKH